MSRAAPKPRQLDLFLDATLSGGSDYASIQDLGDGTVRLEVGHSCVVYMRQVVPVEFLTAAVVSALHPRDIMTGVHLSEQSPQDFLRDFFRTYDEMYVKSLVDAVGEPHD